MGIHATAHAGPVDALLDVFSPLYQAYSAHDVVSVFHSEDFPNFFRNCYPSSGYDFCEEGNVLLIHLNGQSDCRESGCARPGDITF